MARLTSETRATSSSASLTRWMEEALLEARIGLEAGEAPIGALLVNADGDVIGRGHNTIRATGNPTMHAEMNAFANGAGKFDDTGGLCLVSTLEPCVMCTGAAMQAGVTTIIYGLPAPADSGTGRVSPPTSPDATNPVVTGGIRAAASRALFVQWLENHEGDESREGQRAFISQLL